LRLLSGGVLHQVGFPEPIIPCVIIYSVDIDEELRDARKCQAEVRPPVLPRSTGDDLQPNEGTRWGSN
jgi:hypothetical protein